MPVASFSGARPYVELVLRQSSGPRRSLATPEFCEQSLRSDDLDAAVLAEGKQMAMIPGHQHLDPGLDHTGEDQVAVRVAAHLFGPALGGGDDFRGEIHEQLLDRPPSIRFEANLPRQDPLQLDQHRSGEDQFDPAVDRLLEDPARRPGSDERRDEDVGVAGDAQDQRRPERDSSTNASLSAGPMPTASVRPRP